MMIILTKFININCHYKLKTHLYFISFISLLLIIFALSMSPLETSVCVCVKIVFPFSLQSVEKELFSWNLKKIFCCNILLSKTGMKNIKYILYLSNCVLLESVITFVYFIWFIIFMKSYMDKNYILFVKWCIYSVIRTLFNWK